MQVTKVVKCPNCKGKGGFELGYPLPPGTKEIPILTCHLCLGKGKVNTSKLIGEYWL